MIWSEYDGSRWRLVDRTFDGKTDRWRSRRYVAPEGDRQSFPRATTDADLKPWVVWQDFSQDNLEIRASSFSDGGWSPAITVSESASNDWAPSITAAPDGSVWIGWDSYQAGNYGVFLRSVKDGRLGSLPQVTRGPSRDAFASVAVDSRNRVWVAWSEAGPNWGKDWGVLGKPGTQIRTDSRIRLARLADGR